MRFLRKTPRFTARRLRSPSAEMSAAQLRRDGRSCLCLSRLSAPRYRPQKKRRNIRRFERDDKRSRLAGDDLDAAVRLVEFHDAVLQCEEGPVATHADILAGVRLAAALTDEDGAGEHGLTAETFYPKPLCFARATVGGCTLTCFMRHDGCVV